jgi:REP element-mobilizing transposase RayT
VGFPLAYHITWGTYGTRLHGCDRPHVDRDHNQYGAPLAPTDPIREAASRDRMKEEPVYLTIEERALVKQAIEDLVRRYGWKLHTLAVQKDHVHVILTAPRDGEPLRDALKAVASKWLNKRFGARQWWAEKGSAKYLFEQSYFENAFDYVHRQREF